MTLEFSRNGDADACLEHLEVILRQLPELRTSPAFLDTVRGGLLPPLTRLRHDSILATRIIDTIVKIFLNLTMPDEGASALLQSCKGFFSEGRVTKAIVNHVKFFVEGDLEMDLGACESIDNCLLLLRNVLHVPEAKNGTPSSSLQNQIIWNLFTQGVDKIIIFLISCPQKMYWGVSMVQLIALLYKDQHVGTLQKLLNQWLEASLSDSSDNESNTSPPERGSGDDSSPVTDSSDADATKTSPAPKKAFQVTRGKSTETEVSTSTSSGVSSEASDKKKECQSSQSEDFGYVTQMENQESISTSSNEEDQPQQKHQKPHIFQKTRKGRATTALEKKELRRKKLVKRSKTNTINMKGLMHHLPTDEDVSNILKEFTVDFLLKGYSSLVHDLHHQLLSNPQLQIDTSHFFWLVTYFLKFSTQLELDLEHVEAVLSHEIISFLVFQGVCIYEELEICKKLPKSDLKPCLRRLHLVVTAIREFLQAVENYQKMIHLNEDDRETLLGLQEQITEMEDLRSIFLLLLRQYDPAIQSRQYLQDLILTNHNYLLFLDGATKERRRFNMVEHLKQFATTEIMRQYGLLLEGFSENGEFVNNCIFTMMHHIGGDLSHVGTLFQPGILKTFTEIWDTDYEICDDWSDLIEFIIHKFVNNPEGGCAPPEGASLHPQTTPEHEEREETVDDGVKILRDYLFKDNRGKFVTWLQDFLVETCFVKLVLSNPREFEASEALNQPVIHHFALLNLPIPVVPWSCEQNAILKYQSFVLLLHKLGFYLPIDTGKVFVTIPNFWNAEYVYSVAQQLGPIDPAKLKFDVTIFKSRRRREKSILTNHLNVEIPSEDQRTIECYDSCETASIASDLTRMCVSDEEDKLTLVVEKN